MVSTAAPSHCAASIRQPRTTTPDPHRAGAADAVLAADMTAGENEIVAQEIDQVLRASTVSVTVAPFTVSVMSQRVSLMARP